MKLKPLYLDLQRYCQPSTIINSEHPDIIALAHQLVKNQSSDIGIIKLSFEWVRDHNR